MILRPGAVTQEELAALLDSPVLLDGHLVSATEVPKAPGMKYKHYAPDTEVLMVKPQDWPAALNWVQTKSVRAGVIADQRFLKPCYDTAAVFMYAKDTVEAASKSLFAGLRALDEPQLALEVILVETFPSEGLGTAYMNRLTKAANGRFFEPMEQ